MSGWGGARMPTSCLVPCRSLQQALMAICPSPSSQETVSHDPPSLRDGPGHARVPGHGGPRPISRWWPTWWARAASVARAPHKLSLRKKGNSAQSFPEPAPPAPQNGRRGVSQVRFLGQVCVHSSMEGCGKGWGRAHRRGEPRTAKPGSLGRSARQGWPGPAVP